MAVRLVERTKVCTRCGEDRPWSDYYAGKKWEDGTMRVPQSRCKLCMHAVQRPRNSKAREWHRQWQREAYRRWREDPEWVGKRRAQDREGQRRRKGITPDRYRLTHERGNGGPTVDAGPFAAWLSRILAERGLSYNDAAAIIGTDGSRLGKIANGKQARVSLDLVDRALLALDGPRLDTLYPVSDAA